MCNTPRIDIDYLNPRKVGVAVTCAACKLRKKPVGRSAPMEMANSLCDSECVGYYAMPFPGSLWPGESEADFGFSVGNAGTKVLSQPEETHA